MNRALVAGVDRANQICRCVTDTGETVDAAYLGTPPWPLATVLLDDTTPANVAFGPLGDRRQILVDDFCWHLLSAPYLHADTPWLVTTTGGGSVSAVTDPGDTAAGVTRLSAPANPPGSSSARIRKLDRAITVPEEHGLAMTARVRLGSLFDTEDAGCALWVGLANSEATDLDGLNAADVAAHAVAEPGAHNWAYNTSQGVNYAHAETGEPTDSATWYHLDIVMVAGQFAAFWYDGAGPYVSTTYVPAAGDQALEPFALVLHAGASGTAIADIDLVTVDLVAPVTDPARIDRDPLFAVVVD